ncbi:conserved hypothetical protein [Luminiphilus syltensis NOR5-1B]|uniref:SpoVT-AbrB domain-containing protein n=1 Tax=Luminiphilus syltensis NOR5-1B TaxID=565045 RepID=B8KV19_9GAMM|nr:conserved hypothetical protein [Luminiphilus syltensis NOR5-1B]
MNLITIGNSKGVRLPAAVIQQCGLVGEIELRVEGDAVILTAAKHPRAGWAAAFDAMASNEDDQLLIPDALEHQCDDEEWSG